MRGHLSDESFAEVLAGEGSSESLAHLETCEPCRVETARISGALRVFKAQSLTWADQREEAQPAPAGVKSGALLAFPRSWLAAAAVVLACAVAGGAYRIVGHEAIADHRAAVHEHAAGSLSADNQLLLSIDQELSAQDQSPVEVYARTSAANATNAPVRE